MWSLAWLEHSLWRGAGEGESGSGQEWRDPAEDKQWSKASHQNCKFFHFCLQLFNLWFLVDDVDDDDEVADDEETRKENKEDLS